MDFWTKEKARLEGLAEVRAELDVLDAKPRLGNRQKRRRQELVMLNTSLELAGIEVDLERHQSIVEEMGDPDLEEAFVEYLKAAHAYRRWLYPQLEEAGLV